MNLTLLTENQNNNYSKIEILNFTRLFAHLLLQTHSVIVDGAILRLITSYSTETPTD